MLVILELHKIRLENSKATKTIGLIKIFDYFWLDVSLKL